MKRKLLLLSLSVLLYSPFKASAQEFPYNLTVFEDAVYYGMYEATVDEPVPAGAIRHSNSSYAKMLTEEQLASFGNWIRMTVTLSPLCDNYDRIGNVNLALVPKGQMTYGYNDENVKRIEIGRFITPFMDMHEEPNEVPYVFQVDNLARLFQDENTTALYDIWIELEVYGYQGGPGQGGAAVEIPGCAGRNDVYMGTLEFLSFNNDHLIMDTNFLLPLSYKYELKNYTLEGTDVLGETVRTINFTLEEDVPNAKLYLITSNHGANEGGEEYERRNHFIYFNDEQVLLYKPGGLSCEPFRQYNTQPNGIYSLNPRPDWQWASFSNWCPGDKIPTRVIELGDLAAGDHSFRIEVPDAEFVDGQGYFPMSLYLQGGEDILGMEDVAQVNFSIYPNPVTDVATIEAGANEVAGALVYNMLGQLVLEGSGSSIDMSSLQNGMYMVKVQFADNKTALRKIMKK